MILLLRLYWEFLLVGLFSMGGGMATVPFLLDMSTRTGWFTSADVATMIAISEATPGPIGINMATYVGYVTAGIPGTVVADIGLVTPAVLIILIVSRLLSAIWEDPRVKALFYGLRPASVGLIAAAAFAVCAVSLFTWDGTLTLHPGPTILFLVMLAAMNLPKLKRISPLVYIGIAAAMGVIFRMNV